MLSINDQNFFTVSEEMAPAATDAAMSLADARLGCAIKGRENPGEDALSKQGLEELTLSTQTLGEEFPKFYSSLVNLIKNSENHIKDVCGDDNR